VTNPPPPVIADFTAQPTSGAVPLTVYFTNLSSGAGTYSWDFGDGNSSNLPSPAHTYTNAGGYSVSLTAVGPGGTNTLSLLSYVVVTNPPPPAVANFVAGPTNGIAPLAVWFTNLSSAAFAYSWDFGDGNVSTDENPSKVYTNSGTYTIGLTAFGAETTNTLTRVNYIVVQTAPPLVLTGALSGIDFILSFESVAGKTYDVEYKGALTDSSWQFLQSISGDGSTIRITNSPATSGERYFRLKTQ
jgi:PKD repeat protein